MSASPRFSPLVDRIGPQEDGSGPEVWRIHFKASQAADEGRLINGHRVILMSVGDPDLDTPKAVREAATRAMEAGDTHYTPIPGKPSLRAAIARRFVDRVGGAWGPQNVMVTAGAQCALFSASLCTLGPGDSVLALEPMYVSYAATVRVSGARLVRVSTPAETGFRPLRERIEAAIDDTSRAILLGTPNNPTGVMLTQDELEVIAEIAIAHNLWVMSDEVYSQIGFERPHVSIAGLPGMAERTITIDGLSKSHAMTGWRIGWAIGPEALIETFDHLGLCMLYGLPGFTQEGAVAALSDAAEGGAWEASAEMRETYRRRRDLFVRAVNQVEGLSCTPPEGGMFGLVDVRGTGLSAADFSEGLFERTGVSVLDGAAFGPSAAGFVRVSFAVSEAEIDEATRRIAGFVSEL